MTLHTAATDPALDAAHTHSDHMIRYASDCARCVATQALIRAAAAYRRAQVVSPVRTEVTCMHCFATFTTKAAVQEHETANPACAGMNVVLCWV